MASSSGNDDDLTIPRAAINKMIKETLPNVRVANDARELVVNCCTEFIHLISSEANEICNKSEKKTISPEHVIQAIQKTKGRGLLRVWRRKSVLPGLSAAWKGKVVFVWLERLLLGTSSHFVVREESVMFGVKSPNPFVFFPPVKRALESLGFGSYISEVKEVLQECKTVALKRRKASSRLENLGIPEEELLRQQQELFAKARQQQAELAQQEWLQMQQAAQQAQLAAASASASNQAGSSQDEDDEDDI
ncbi:protein Dr1 isoform 1-T1 [Morus bassanus]